MSLPSKYGGFHLPRKNESMPPSKVEPQSVLSFERLILQTGPMPRDGQVPGTQGALCLSTVESTVLYSSATVALLYI